MVYKDLDYVTKGEEQEQSGQQPQITPVASGGPSSSGGQQSSSSQAPTQNQSKARFTNVSKYVNANKGQSDKLQSGIQKKISNEAEQVREGINQAQTQFQQQAGQTQANLDKANQYANQIQQVGGAQQIADVEPEFQNFRNIYTGQVASPTQNISSQQESLNKLRALNALSGTESGRYDLLSQAFQSPTGDYSVGEKKLDQLILQASPGAVKSLQDYGSELNRDLTSQYTQAEKDQAQRIKDLSGLSVQQQELLKTAMGEFDAEQLAAAQAEAQKYQQEGREYTPEELSSVGTGALGNIYNELLSGQRGAIGKQFDDIETARTALREFDPYGQAASGSGKVGGVGSGYKDPRFMTEEELAILALDPNLRTYGLDMSQFAENLRQADTDITLADIANEEQISRLNALYRLAGLDESSINLGERFGRQGAEIAEDFMGIRQAQEDKWISDNIKKLSDTFLYDPSYTGGGYNDGITNMGQAANWMDRYYGTQLNQKVPEIFKDAFSDLSTALSSDAGDVNYRESLAKAFQDAIDFNPYNQMVGWAPRREDLLYAGTREALLGLGADGLELTEFYDHSGHSTEDRLKGRTFTEYLNDLLSQSRQTLSGAGDENS